LPPCVIDTAIDSARCRATSCRGQLHLVEVGDAEEVTDEAGGPVEARGRARRAQRDRRDVAAHRSPDLPIARERGRIDAVAAAHRGVLAEVTHGPEQAQRP